MTFDSGRKGQSDNELFDIEHILNASTSGELSRAKQPGRRARRRAAKSRASQLSLLAPLLAAEGCLSTGKEDIPLAAAPSEPEPSQPTTEAPVSNITITEPTTTPPPEVEETSAPTPEAKLDGNFQTKSGAALSITAADLMAAEASEGEVLQLVRVFGAVNGTVSLSNGVVTFTPDEGFEGEATFQYEVIDQNGARRTITSEVTVTPATEDQEDEGNGAPQTDGAGEDSSQDNAAGNEGDDTAQGEAAEQDEQSDQEQSGSEDTTDSGHEDMSGGSHATGGGHVGDTDPAPIGDDTINGGTGGHAGHMDPDDDSEHTGGGSTSGDGSTGGSGSTSGAGGSGGHTGHTSGGTSGSHAHPSDPALAAEHTALLNLVPVAQATHVAVNDGSWFDPNTWAGGVVPDDGAQVLIPDGVTVDYDGQSAASLFTVRVDGALHFATDQDTFMEVDTLIVSPSGAMTMGTALDPVQPGVEAVIQIADNGPIDVAWDPMLLSRGVMSHGQIEIHGAEKESFLKVATDPMAGDTSLTLESLPDGWEVGDKIVLTGTHLTDSPSALPGETRNITTQDEELVITSIQGNVIHFDRALQYDHDTPRADLKAYVSNQTRNVVIQTENADALPAHQRGHVMFMHSDDIDVRYAQFEELGRTDKSERADDAADFANIAADSNVKGRYALHIHRAGVSDLDDPAMLVGNAVNGSPGWGIVHHDSNAVITDNAVYDVFGAAYVAETGNETGRWSQNIAIKSIGVGGTVKHGADVDAFDLGRTGVGFWFQGRTVDAVDNVAASIPGGHGFVYMARGRQRDLIDVIPGDTDHPDSLRYLDSAEINIPAISQFYGNEALAVSVGVEVVKGNPAQGHDIRSTLQNFTAWEVGTGVHLQYTAHYTLRDIDIIGTDQSQGGRTPVRGIFLDNNAVDVVLNNVNIDNFERGVEATRKTVNLANFDGDFRYAFIDVDFQNVGTDYVNSAPADLILDGSQLNQGALQFTSDLSNIPTGPRRPGTGALNLTGTKTDSIGTTDVTPSWDPALITWEVMRGAVEQNGYWTLPDGRTVTIIEQYISDRATGFLTKVGIPVEFLNTDLTSGGFTRTPPVYHGELDVNSLAPVANDDTIIVGQNGSITFDPLANDFDPDGDTLAVDGFIYPKHGSVFVNPDGTVSYFADPNYTGSDHLCYWVTDGHGNFTMGEVFVDVQAGVVTTATSHNGGGHSGHTMMNMTTNAMTNATTSVVDPAANVDPDMMMHTHMAMHSDPLMQNPDMVMP